MMSVLKKPQVKPPKNGSCKDVSGWVRHLLMSVYGEQLPNGKVECMRTYSECYNKNSWRYKWCAVRGFSEVHARMIDWTNEVLCERMVALFGVEVRMKYLNSSIILLAKPVKQK